MIELTTWKCKECGREFTSFVNRHQKLNDCVWCECFPVPVVWVLLSEHEEELIRIKNETAKLLIKQDTDFKAELVIIQKEIKELHTKECFDYILSTDAPKYFNDIVDDVFGEVNTNVLEQRKHKD